MCMTVVLVMVVLATSNAVSSLKLRLGSGSNVVVEEAVIVRGAGSSLELISLLPCDSAWRMSIKDIICSSDRRRRRRISCRSEGLVCGHSLEKTLVRGHTYFDRSLKSGVFEIDSYRGKSPVSRLGRLGVQFVRTRWMRAEETRAMRNRGV